MPGAQNQDCLSRTHSIENTFYREHILQRTHAIEYAWRIRPRLPTATATCKPAETTGGSSSRVRARVPYAMQRHGGSTLPNESRSGGRGGCGMGLGEGVRRKVSA